MKWAYISGTFAAIRSFCSSSCDTSFTSIGFGSPRPLGFAVNRFWSGNFVLCARRRVACQRCGARLRVVLARDVRSLSSSRCRVERPGGDRTFQEVELRLHLEIESHQRVLYFLRFCENSFNLLEVQKKWLEVCQLSHSACKHDVLHACRCCLFDRSLLMLSLVLKVLCGNNENTLSSFECRLEWVDVVKIAGANIYSHLLQVDEFLNGTCDNNDLLGVFCVCSSALITNCPKFSVAPVTISEPDEVIINWLNKAI